MTWWFVTMNPFLLSMTTPEPAPSGIVIGPASGGPIGGTPICEVRTLTTAGWTLVLARRNRAEVRPIMSSLSSFSNASVAAIERPTSYR